jgi:hypothetical protein
VIAKCCTALGLRGWRSTQPSKLLPCVIWLFFLVVVVFDSTTPELYGLMYLRYVTSLHVILLYNNVRDNLSTLSVADLHVSLALL